MFLWCMDVARTTEKDRKRCRDGEFFATPPSLSLSFFFHQNMFVYMWLEVPKKNLRRDEVSKSINIFV